MYESERITKLDNAIFILSLLEKELVPVATQWGDNMILSKLHAWLVSTCHSHNFLQKTNSIFTHKEAFVLEFSSIIFELIVHQ